MIPEPKEILVIRRDNIGDLLCTTPLLAALRRRFPAARISALVNSYNAPALAGNPDVDEIFVYEKAKHRRPGMSWLSWLKHRVGIVLALRRRRIDLAILAAPGVQRSALRFATLAKARRVIGYGLPENDDRFVTVAPAAAAGRHEAEAVFALLAPLGVTGEPPATRLAADEERCRRLLDQLGGRPAGGLVGLHISARKVPQRWPEERFAELARRLLAAGAGGILVFWAPGAENDPQHPGDDDKAARLAAGLADLPVRFVPTRQLEELIAGLALCDAVVCADGGAMHVAAALGKPIVCFFGNSDATRWHPWGVPYELLQKPSREVRDIPVDEAFAAWERLAARCSEKGRGCAATS